MAWHGMAWPHVSHPSLFMPKCLVTLQGLLVSSPFSEIFLQRLLWCRDSTHHYSSAVSCSSSLPYFFLLLVIMALQIAWKEKTHEATQSVIMPSTQPPSQFLVKIIEVFISSFIVSFFFAFFAFFFFRKKASLILLSLNNMLQDCRECSIEVVLIYFLMSYRILSWMEKTECSFI